MVKPQAWKGIVAEAEQHIRDAVDVGDLDARGAGKKLAVKRASFDAWLGRPVTLYPKWAGGYEVLPDDQAAKVEADRHTLEHLRQAMEETPISFDIVPREGGSNLDSLVAVLADSTEQRLLFRWQELIVTEAVVDQIAAEFGGEDPLKPASRAGLQNAKEMAEKLARELSVLGHTVDLPTEAPNEEVSDLRAMLEQSGCVFRNS